MHPLTYRSPEQVAHLKRRRRPRRVVVPLCAALLSLGLFAILWRAVMGWGIGEQKTVTVRNITVAADG